MDLGELKQKVASLPLAPGVYIMKNADDTVIYVGKAKKLRNRVSQYFQDTASHSAKTRAMVSKIDHFDVIIAASEFEALVLECMLIKQYQPKYNILLKDGKGYPYLRLDLRERYPRITMVNRIADDGAEYFGPYGNRSITMRMLESICKTLKLPTCSLSFPRDVGLSRTCLQFHMNHCDGWCQKKDAEREFRSVILKARQIMQGNYKDVAKEIKSQMVIAADALNFELAAQLRDQLNAVERLGEKQFVSGGKRSDTDVIGYAKTETKACFSVLHFISGNLHEKDFEILNVPDDDEAAVSALMKQYYITRGFAPKNVLLPFAVEDSSLFEQYFLEKYGIKVRFKVPMRGDNVRLVDLAMKNAVEEATRATDRDERSNAVLGQLGKMLGMASPERIESFDVSNLSGTDIVAAMVVFEKGKAKRSEYKRFKINDLPNQDDYASMRQALTRRFVRYLNGDKGFDRAPDLLLIDGGIQHATVAVDVLSSLGVQCKVFGMVKDDKHRTRALITADGEEIGIDANQAVFAFVGSIQEETHRFAITYNKKLRSKRLRYSELDNIQGIGPKRKQCLLKAFGSISRIREVGLADLERYLPKDAAMSVYSYFDSQRK